LIAIIRRLEDQQAENEKRIAKLEAEVRESHRSKAAFSKGDRKQRPKKPGRKPGKGVFVQRPEPVAGPDDQVIPIDVPLEVDQRECPKCGVALQTKNEVATVEDMPVTPRRVITRFVVETGCCAQCGCGTRAA
jgi:transposase